jgi:hypothetical protein
MWGYVLALIVLGVVVWSASSRPRRRTTEDSYQSHIRSTKGNAFMFFKIECDEGISTLRAMLPMVDSLVAQLSARRASEVVHHFDGEDDLTLRSIDAFLEAHEIPVDKPPPCLRFTGHNVGVTLLDHAQIGGDRFLALLAASIGGQSPQVPRRSDIPWTSRALAVIRLLTSDLPRILLSSLRPSPLTWTMSRPLYRVQCTIPVPQPPNVRGGIVRLASQFVFAVLGLSIDAEPLSACLPSAFASEPGVRNNVGVVFTSLHPARAPQDIQTELRRNAYQAVATNELLHWAVPASPRSHVDVVLAMGYVRNPPSEIASSITCGVSFFHRPQYAVYTTAFAIGKFLHLSVTSQCVARASLASIHRSFPSAKLF